MALKYIYTLVFLFLVSVRTNVSGTWGRLSPNLRGGVSASAGTSSGSVFLQQKQSSNLSESDSSFSLSLTDGVGNQPCKNYHKLNSSKEICAFIKNNSDCANDDGFFNYLQAVYCGFLNTRWLGLVILALWLVYLLIALGVTAEEFFCPNLDVMSRTLKMSQNIAGVTLLAFGNGAPDIFSAIAAITSSHNGEAGLAIGALFGAGIFVTTVVAGSIAVTRPFKMVERPFLRDSVLYLAAAFWTFVILYRGEMFLLEAVGYIILYFFYVIVVVVGRKIRLYRKRKREALDQVAANSRTVGNGNDLNGGALSETPTYSINSHPSATNSINATHVASINSVHDDMFPSIKDCTYYPLGRRDHQHHHHHIAATRALAAASIIGVPESVVRTITPTPEDDDTNGGESRPLLAGDSERDKPGQIKEFLIGMCPVDYEDWSDKKWFSKLFEIIKIPLILVLNATIPVVNYEEPKHNWNRLLNVFNLLTAPIFCAFVTHGLTKPVCGGLYVWHLVVPISVILATLLFITSKSEKQPIYHWAFSYVGFVVAVLWIYSTANEIVNILQMFGVEFGINDAILGLTVLAWGNSIGDLVADVTMAKQGFPTMGMSACFGGPMLNMLLGIGISCLIVTIQNGGTFQLKASKVQYVLAIGLAVSLVSSMFIMLFTKFRATRWYGLYLFVLYVVFLAVALLVELGAIPW